MISSRDYFLCHFKMDVSENSGKTPPKSSIFVGFSIIHHPFWGTHIFGNTQITVMITTLDLIGITIAGVVFRCFCTKTCGITSSAISGFTCRAGIHIHPKNKHPGVCPRLKSRHGERVEDY